MSGGETAAFKQRHPGALRWIRLTSALVAVALTIEIVVRIVTFISWRRGLHEFEEIRRRHDAGRAFYPVMNVGVVTGEPSSFPAVVPVRDGPPRVIAFGSIDESVFRAPLPVGPPSPGIVRIVFVGGSTTYDGYPELVGARLGPRVEVVNLGVPASNSATTLLMMRRFLPRLRPHVVVTYHGFNDLLYYRARARASDRAARGASATEPAIFVEQPSRGVLGLFSHRDDTLPGIALDGPTRNYEDMATLAREHQFTLYMSTFGLPSYEQLDAFSRRYYEADLRYLWPLLGDVERYRRDLVAYNARVRETTKKLGAQLIDVAAVLHGGRSMFRDNCHNTADGQAVHAAAVASALTPLLAAKP